MVVRWTFTDNSMATPEVWTVPINPVEQNLTQYSKNITYQNTAAPDGKVLVMEGRQNPRTGSFNGVSLTQEHHDTFISWFEKNDQIEVTDDLGRTFSIIITGYNATRRWSVSHPYRHDYTVDFTVVDW